MPVALTVVGVGRAVAAGRLVHRVGRAVPAAVPFREVPVGEVPTHPHGRGDAGGNFSKYSAENCLPKHPHNPRRRGNASQEATRDTLSPLGNVELDEPHGGVQKNPGRRTTPRSKCTIP